MIRECALEAEDRFLLHHPQGLKMPPREGQGQGATQEATVLMVVCWGLGAGDARLRMLGCLLQSSPQGSERLQGLRRVALPRFPHLSEGVITGQMQISGHCSNQCLSANKYP